MRVEVLESLLQNEITERREAKHFGYICKGSQDARVEFSRYKGWLIVHGFVVSHFREIWEFFMNQFKKGFSIVGKCAQELVESLQARIRFAIRPAHQGNCANVQLIGDALSLLGVSNNASQ